MGDVKNRKTRTLNHKYSYSINGDWCEPHNRVGYCWNKMHRGCITRRTAKEHKCLEKNCRFLQKTNKRYWESRENSVKGSKIYIKNHKHKQASEEVE